MSQIFKPEASSPPPPGFVISLTANTGTNPVPPDPTDTIFIGSALVSARSVPITTLGSISGHFVDVVMQLTTASASSVVNNVGLASFNSANFTVDSNGYVSLNGGSVGETITGQSGGALSPTAGNWNIFGASVAAGSTPVVTSGSVSTLTVNVQTSQAIAATDVTKIGLSNFNSAQFTVDANGFVGLKGSSVNPGILGVHPNATSGGGTDPTVADASGNISILGATVAAGTHPIRSVATAANSLTLQAQISQAIASTDATKIGLSNFNSAQFTVDANGFVSTSGTGIGNTITGQTGGALSPTAGNWNIFGDGVSASGVSTAGNIFTAGSGSTLTISPTQAQFMTNYTQVLVGASPYTALLTDYYISCVSSGGAITIKLPNAPTTNRLFIIKDNAGDASVNNITITTVGGSVLIDGATSYVIAGNYGAISLLFNSVGYEIF